MEAAHYAGPRHRTERMGGCCQCRETGSYEQLTFFRPLYKSPRSNPHYGMAMIVAVALVVVPWTLVGWTIWMLTS